MLLFFPLKTVIIFFPHQTLKSSKLSKFLCFPKNVISCSVHTFYPDLSQQSINAALNSNYFMSLSYLPIITTSLPIMCFPFEILNMFVTDKISTLRLGHFACCFRSNRLQNPWIFLFVFEEESPKTILIVE